MAGSDTRLGSPSFVGSGFRPDIEGLRAVAIGLVLAYHAGVRQVPGGFVGVDVFFVVSGFLITGLLIREAERTGRVSLVQFWARRAKRLLPASALTLAVTAVGAWLIAPATHWREFGGDIAAAALYFVNWRFAAQAIDYNAEGAGVSPVLHFWSLAVEEQFYIVWPLLVVAVALLVRKTRRLPLRSALAATILAVIVPSFVWSVAYTGSNPDGAFFITTTRLWELGIGASVAIGANLWPRIAPAIATMLGWSGAVAILLAALTFSSETAWPGAGALAPTLGAAAVIVATTGREASAFSIARPLGLRPMVWVGGLSYSLYLWHWPFLVLGEAQLGELGVKKSLGLIAGSAVVAWLSLKLVENPIRYSGSVSRSSKLALSLGANFSLVGAVAGMVLVLAIPAGTNVQRNDIPGARYLESGEFARLSGELADRDTADLIVPIAVDANRDLPEAQQEGCLVRHRDAEVRVCEYGAKDSETTVAVVGDSKILQWHTALARIAHDEGWRLLTYYKSACAFASPEYEQTEPDRAECAEWNHSTLQMLLEEKPAVVVTSGRQVFEGSQDGDRTPGAEMIATWWTQLIDGGIRVIPILDNPSPPFQVHDCVGENPDRLSECAFDRDKAIRSSGAEYLLIAGKISGVDEFVDMADITCPGVERCPAVIGNVLVYRQGSHLTRTFVETATDALAERLVPLVDAAIAKG